eukprot:3732261-Rhodomonas_salina.1
MGLHRVANTVELEARCQVVSGGVEIGSAESVYNVQLRTWRRFVVILRDGSLCLDESVTTSKCVYFTGSIPLGSWTEQETEVQFMVANTASSFWGEFGEM